MGGTFSQKLMALDPTTGANTGYINVAVTGTVASNAGPKRVYKFAVSPDGTRLVAVGNFTSVGGQARRRAFMLELGLTSGTVSPWYYQPLDNMCQAAGIPAYMRDVDFSPDGRYFVFVSIGFVPTSGGIGRDLCDATARSRRPSRPQCARPGSTTPAVTPLHSVAVTGAAVCVQGRRLYPRPAGRQDAAGLGRPRREAGKRQQLRPGDVGQRALRRLPLCGGQLLRAAVAVRLVILDSREDSRILSRLTK